jgi:glycosyltransferase involved in cell wall biosynthesis
VTGSRASATALRHVLRLPDDTVIALPNGVVPREPDETRAEARNRLGLSANDIVVLVAARFESRKGHRHLFGALQLLAERRGLDGVAVVLAGDGPDERSLRADAARRGLEHVVRFVPPQPNWWNFYEAADMVALPSVANEDFPNVVIEAMAMSKPVVASSIAGIPEQIEDGVTGFLVAPGDEAALADAVEQLLDSPELRARLGDAGRARFDAQFTPEAAVERYWSLYRELYVRAVP